MPCLFYHNKVLSIYATSYKQTTFINSNLSSTYCITTWVLSHMQMDSSSKHSLNSYSSKLPYKSYKQLHNIEM